MTNVPHPYGSCSNHGANNRANDGLCKFLALFCRLHFCLVCVCVCVCVCVKNHVEMLKWDIMQKVRDERSRQSRKEECIIDSMHILVNVHVPRIVLRGILLHI